MLFHVLDTSKDTTGFSQQKDNNRLGFGLTYEVSKNTKDKYIQINKCHNK